jgi:membrane protein YdbS with pleckstrin-like domain
MQKVDFHPINNRFSIFDITKKICLGIIIINGLIIGSLLLLFLIMRYSIFLNLVILFLILTIVEVYIVLIWNEVYKRKGLKWDLMFRKEEKNEYRR